MRYPSGESVKIGDNVRIERGRTPGRVTEIVENQAHALYATVGEPGLMLESAPFGLVFWPERSEDPAVFVGRATLADAEQ